MEYIVSARKYRPLSFDTVVGQAALTTTLKNAVVVPVVQRAALIKHLRARCCIQQLC